MFFTKRRKLPPQFLTCPHHLQQSPRGFPSGLQDPISMALWWVQVHGTQAQALFVECTSVGDKEGTVSESDLRTLRMWSVEPSGAGGGEIAPHSNIALLSSDEETVSSLDGGKRALRSSHLRVRGSSSSHTVMHVHGSASFCLSVSFAPFAVRLLSFLPGSQEPPGGSGRKSSAARSPADPSFPSAFPFRVWSLELHRNLHLVPPRFPCSVFCPCVNTLP